MGGFVVERAQLPHPPCCPCLSFLGCLFSAPVPVVTQVLILGFFSVGPTRGWFNPGVKPRAAGSDKAVAELAFTKAFMCQSHSGESGRAIGGSASDI